MPVPFLACMALTAHFYGLPPRVLPSIQAVEGGRPGLVHPNTDGSADLGLMQINTRWVVPIAPFAVFGTEALAERVVETMGSGYACLMAHHGQVTIGQSWQQALAVAEEIEEQAAITYGALLLGGAPVLSAAELAGTVAQFASYGQRKA